jgi:uncharacterized membrane protein YdbT with pleckstrin-like domain
MALPHLTDPDEKVILDTPPHILFLTLPILGVVALWFLYLFIACPLILPSLDGGCFLISSLAFLVLILALFIDWVNNRLILTNLKVTRERGIIGKTIMTVELDKVQDIKIYFGIFGRFFGFGTLEIKSAGTFGKMIFKGSPSPRTVKGQIEEVARHLIKV